MSWRLLAASGVLLICLVIPECVRAQESASSAKGKSDSATAGSADQASSPDETTAATDKSTTKTTAAKAKSASSKAKSKKSAGRTDSSGSSGSSGSEPKYELATFGGWLFLACRGGFRAAQRGGLGGFGLRRRSIAEPYLRNGSRRVYRARRGCDGAVRPRGD